MREKDNEFVEHSGNSSFNEALFEMTEYEHNDDISMLHT